MTGARRPARRGRWAYNSASTLYGVAGWHLDGSPLVLDFMPGFHDCCCADGPPSHAGMYLLYNWPGREHEAAATHVASAMATIEREWDALTAAAQSAMTAAHRASEERTPVTTTESSAAAIAGAAMSRADQAVIHRLIADTDQAGAAAAAAGDDTAVAALASIRGFLAGRLVAATWTVEPPGARDPARLDRLICLIMNPAVAAALDAGDPGSLTAAITTALARPGGSR